jgi:hypothetical protein
VAAFSLLRPNPPQQTTAQQLPTAPVSPPPGATPGAATPGASGPNGPLLRGSYNFQMPWATGVVTATSDCPGCDATVTFSSGSAIYHWTGTSWMTGGSGGSCTGTLTPTAIVNGIAQELSMLRSECGGVEAHSGTMTRTGD